MYLRLNKTEQKVRTKNYSQITYWKIDEKMKAFSVPMFAFVFVQFSPSMGCARFVKRHATSITIALKWIVFFICLTGFIVQAYECIETYLACPLGRETDRVEIRIEGAARIFKIQDKLPGVVGKLLRKLPQF